MDRGVLVGGSAVVVGCAGTAVATWGRLVTVGNAVAVFAAASGVFVGAGVSSVSPPHAARSMTPNGITTRPIALGDLNSTCS